MKKQVISRDVIESLYKVVEYHYNDEQKFFCENYDGDTSIIPTNLTTGHIPKEIIPKDWVFYDWEVILNYLEMLETREHNEKILKKFTRPSIKSILKLIVSKVIPSNNVVEFDGELK